MSHVMLKGALCGRPDSHRGQCVSVDALKRSREKDRYRNQLQLVADPDQVRKERREKAQRWRLANPEKAREKSRNDSRRRQLRLDIFVYAIFFPELRILKIGSGKDLSSCRDRAVKRVTAKGLSVTEVIVIWKHTVSQQEQLLHEQRIQTEIGYDLDRWTAICGNKMPEWFETNNYTEEDLMIMLKAAQAYIDRRIH